MSKYHQPLLSGQVYHLFSRAVGNEKLFQNSGNYIYFLRKLKQFTSRVSKIYCYTLLPNHFHFLVQINDENVLREQFELVKKKSFDKVTDSLSDFVMERYSNFLNSYTKSFNKINHRKGALFMDYMKRSLVNKESDFTNFVWYIHKNAVHHQLVQKIGEWPFDSYRSILSNSKTSLQRQDIIDWFGNKEAFIEFHQQSIYPKNDILDI